MIKSIKLTNFRNYKNSNFEFSPKTTVIVGANAAGKTNILESVFLLSTGKSFHARLEGEMVNYDADIARVSGKITKEVDTDQENVDLEVVLTRGLIDMGTEHPEKAPRKKLMVNGVPRHLYTFSGNLKTVLFGPWDMDLVTESPSVRRKFLDTVLSQADKEYRRALLSYEKGLRQRNKILYRIREEGISRSALFFWDQLLIKNGDYLSRKREEFIEFANSSPDFVGQDFSLEYDKSAISEGRLDEYKNEEVASATTLVGPHRDDMKFRIRSAKSERVRELEKYGSRGEQRMGVLWLKLAELSYLEKVTLEKPTLLLDDIFSELDHTHRDIVTDVTRNQQTLITTADEHFIADLKSEGIIRL